MSETKMAQALRHAFITAQSCGPDNHYELVCRFGTLGELQTAHRAILELRASHTAQGDGYKYQDGEGDLGSARHTAQGVADEEAADLRRMLWCVLESVGHDVVIRRAVLQRYDAKRAVIGKTMDITNSGDYMRVWTQTAARPAGEKG